MPPIDTRHALHGGVGVQNRRDLLLNIFQSVERNLGSGLGKPDHETCVALRDKAFRQHDVKLNGESQRRERDEEHQPSVPKRVGERALVSPYHPFEKGFNPAVEPGFARAWQAADEAAANHRCESEGHHRRNEDRVSQGPGEFPEKPPDRAAHEQKRDESGHQRQADGYDGEADLPGALQGGFERLHPGFHVAVAVLDHDDGVVHDETDGDGQSEKRDVVEAIAGKPHEPDGARKRKRHRDARSDRRNNAAEKDQHHHHDERNACEKRLLNVADAGPDGLGSIVQNLKLHIRGKKPVQLREQSVDLIDGVDDVCIRRLEDDENDGVVFVVVSGREPVACAR